MSNIENIISAERKRLEGVIRAAYDAGWEDARADMLRTLAGESQGVDNSGKDVQGGDVRRRAPRGLPKKFTERVVAENYLYGVTPQGISDAAITDEEKMISVSSIRNELRKGRDSNRFYEDKGRWFPVKNQALQNRERGVISSEKKRDSGAAPSTSSGNGDVVRSRGIRPRGMLKDPTKE